MVAITKSIPTIPNLIRENRHLRFLLRAKTAGFDTLAQKLKIEASKRNFTALALRKSEKHHVLMLDQSRRMQEHLRFLTHKILTAQEDERREISRELHDEIAQTLTGINVRLANLKREATLNTKGLKGK